MRPEDNPFTPTAGRSPPELVGRDPILERAAFVLDRVRAGYSQPSLVLIGLRGVGKTVLLREIEKRALKRGFAPVRVETTERQDLPAQLALGLRSVLLELDRVAALREKLRYAFGVLRSFVNIRFQFGGLEANISADPIAGQADSGSLDRDLGDLFRAIGAAAREQKTAVVLLVDEMQYATEEELEALVVGMHQVEQDGLPVTLVAAGLPPLRGALGAAKSYTERLFEYPPVGSLARVDADKAIRDPMILRSVDIEPAALEFVFATTKGYPYFIQTWGSFTWNAAATSPVTLADVRRATEAAVPYLDANFFGHRFDRVTSAERRYLRAMASLGDGPYRVGRVASALRTTTSALGVARDRLIKKGIIYDPSHGLVEFTVPMFAEFMRRRIPSTSVSDW